MGAAIGVSLAGLFNPVDRALYLMVTHHRPFLSRANFDRPWQGFSQAVLVRTISGGMFYPLFDVWRRAVAATLGPTAASGSGSKRYLVNVAAGQLAGISIAVAMNPLNAVKYCMWESHYTTLYQTAGHMWRAGGAAAFTKGMQATAVRDAVFGGAYAACRSASGAIGSDGRAPRGSVALDLAAASAATVFSSPVNYARNMSFHTPAGETAPGIGQSLRHLREGAQKQRVAHGARAAAGYLQLRLGLGWGTLRVGLGMSFGQQMYDASMRLGQ